MGGLTWPRTISVKLSFKRIKDIMDAKSDKARRKATFVSKLTLGRVSPRSNA